MKKELRTARVELKFPPSLKKKLKAVAKRSKISLNELIIDSLESLFVIK